VRAVSRALPKTTFSELIQELNLLVRDGLPATPFQHRLWEAEADKLMRVSANLGLEIKAYLAGIDGDDDEVDRLYETALKISDDFVGTFIRYLILLSHRLRSEKVLEVFRALSGCVKGNVSATRFLEEFIAAEGFMVTAWKLSDELKKMGTYSGSAPASESEILSQVVDPDGFSDVEFSQPVVFSKRFLAKRGVKTRAFSCAPCAFEDGRTAIHYQIDADLSPSEAAEVEWDLHEALGEQGFPVEASGKLVISLVGTRAELA
jgi:hypothetical protein